MVKIAFYFIFLALLMVGLYIAARVAAAYVRCQEWGFNYVSFNEDYEPGAYVWYWVNGGSHLERLQVRGFKPVFEHYPDADVIVFENVNGCCFRVKTDDWHMIEVPERENDYAGR